MGLNMIKVDVNSKVIQKIKGARSLKDLASILKKLTIASEEHSDATDALLDSVSTKLSIPISISARRVKTTEVSTIEPTAKTREEKLSDGQKQIKRKKAAQALVRIKDFKAPSLKDLIRDSESLSIFAQQITELETLKRTLFSDNFANLPNTKSLIKSTEKTIKETKISRDKQLKAMNLAVNTKPKEVKRFSSLVANVIRANIPEDLYSKFSQKSYLLHPNKQTIWYQTYYILQDFLIDEDYIIDTFIFVVTSIVNLETGYFDNHLTLIKDPKIPGSFDTGPFVETDAKMKRYFNALLSSEDYKESKMRRRSLKGTRFPTTKTLKEKGGVLNSSEFVDNVRIHKNRIYFTLIPGVDKEEIDQAVVDLKLAMNTLYARTKRGNSAIKHKIERSVSKNTVHVIFAITPDATAEEKMLHKVDRISQVLGIDKATARKLKESLIRAS